MPTLTLVCTIHGPDLASGGALPDVSCAPVHGRRTALQTWASRKPRRLRLDGQGRDVERSRLADEGQSWHQSACNVWYARGNADLVMERMVPSPDGLKFGWGVNRLAPVLMRAKETDDMTDFRSLVY